MQNGGGIRMEGFGRKVTFLMFVVLKHKVASCQTVSKDLVFNL